MTEEGKHNSRFGSKYGRKIRERYVEVDKKQRQKQNCPECNKSNAKRLSGGVFECKSCGKRFSANTYFN